eukprot:TRINITY_DN21964_c0_g1_i1.p1 TRINITY_DN21964_c0_g1~~TRINITY_DN21964_c0_g1_i1.p1  ORF type:complete len:191 (+),score=45.67 TRINITY_DN21964_c0_g1_i1:40-573(+)
MCEDIKNTPWMNKDEVVVAEDLQAEGMARDNDQAEMQNNFIHLVSTEVNSSSIPVDIKTFESSAKANPILKKLRKQSKLKNSKILDEGSDPQNSVKIRKPSSKTQNNEVRQPTLWISASMKLPLHCPICKAGVQNKSHLLGHMRMKLEQQCKSCKLYCENCQRLSIHKEGRCKASTK